MTARPGATQQLGPSTYVAGRTSDMERVRRVQQLVRDAGGSITFDWTGADGEVRKSWADAPDRARELSERERRAVIDADVTILVCHPDPGGAGCFIEAGIAMAHDRWVWVLDAHRDSVFFYLPCVTMVPHEAILPHLLRAWTPECRLSEHLGSPVAAAGPASFKPREQLSGGVA